MPTHQILYSEEMVGANHPTKGDTLNRFLNLITAQGDIPYGTAAATAAALAKGAANTKTFMNAGATAPEWASGLFIGTKTYDTATASGDQVITEVGFKPKIVIILSAVDGTVQASFGFDDGTKSYSIVYNYSSLWTVDGTRSVFLYQASGIHSRAYVTAIGADGFTLSWTKTGEKTGTASLYYLALR